MHIHSKDLRAGVGFIVVGTMLHTLDGQGNCISMQYTNVRDALEQGKAFIDSLRTNPQPLYPWSEG